MLIVVWWSSSTQREAKETLYSVPINLRFYYSLVVVARKLATLQPDAPPVALQSRLISPLMISVEPKRPDLPQTIPLRL